MEERENMFNAKRRNKAMEHYNVAVERYEYTATQLGENTDILYKKRQSGLRLIKLIEEKVNQLANSPKEFKVTFQKIEIEVENFKAKQEEIERAEIEAKAAIGGAGAGATLSAIGIAVATMGPTAAMGIATTFGVASTGTAISTLSGAAATNAALAWLGGGALATGGGGMTAGSAFLALAGPVGWTIAGVMFAGSIGSGLFASRKNKKTAIKLIDERENLEKIIRKFNTMNSEVEALAETTQTQIDGITKAEENLIGTDYSKFSKDEKIHMGFLVNSTLTLAQLINKELELNGE